MGNTQIPDQEEVRRRFHGDDGANLVEYAMLLALIVVVCLSAVQLFGRNAASKMQCASSAVVSQAGGVTC